MGEVGKIDIRCLPPLFVKFLCFYAKNTFLCKEYISSNQSHFFTCKSMIICGNKHKFSRKSFFDYSKWRETNKILMCLDLDML